MIGGECLIRIGRVLGANQRESIGDFLVKRFIVLNAKCECVLSVFY